MHTSNDRDIKRCTPPLTQQQVETIVGASTAACSPDGSLTADQSMVARAISLALTGIDVDPATLAPQSAAQLADAVASLDGQFRERIVQYLSLIALLLNPVPDEVVANVTEYATAMGVGHVCTNVLNRHPDSTNQAALYDFARNGYSSEFFELGAAPVLHADGDDLGDGWGIVEDAKLAERWNELGNCADGTLGNAVFEFYRARHFNVPGTGPTSTPPLLAQHDWAHVLANYGTAVPCELEVFGFLSASDDQPNGFALLAMVVGLFATGAVDHAASIFDADPGHLDTQNMAVRLADAIRRGQCASRPDGDRAGGLLATDWFAYKDLAVDDARRLFNVPPKSQDAIAAGSSGVWDESGLSDYQMTHCDLDVIADMRARAGQLT